MPPLVSVIVPAHEAGPFIRAAVHSALGQSYANLEVIVVDDGSRARVDWICDAAPDRVRYQWKENGGPASARNLGARMARGELLAFLDADDVWDGQKVEVQVSSLGQHPNAAVAYTAFSTIDDQGLPIDTSPKAFAGSGWIFDQLFQGNFICNSSVMVRRSAFDEVGGFDEDHALISVEDYDLWLRLAERHQFVFSPEPLVLYRCQPFGLSRDPCRSYRGERRVIERAVARNHTLRPELASRIGRRLGDTYLRLGIELLMVDRQAEARGALLRSLRFRPWQPSAWAHLGAALVGPTGVRRARRVQRGLRAVLHGATRRRGS